MRPHNQRVPKLGEQHRVRHALQLRLLIHLLDLKLEFELIIRPSHNLHIFKTPHHPHALQLRLVMVQSDEKPALKLIRIIQHRPLVNVTLSLRQLTMRRSHIEDTLETTIHPRVKPSVNLLQVQHPVKGALPPYKLTTSRLVKSKPRQALISHRRVKDELLGILDNHPALSLLQLVNPLRPCRVTRFMATEDVLGEMLPSHRMLQSLKLTLSGVKRRQSVSFASVKFLHKYNRYVFSLKRYIPLKIKQDVLGKQKDPVLVLREKVRDVLSSFPESEASYTQVERFKARPLSRNGPAGQRRDYDLVGDLGTAWNKQLIGLLVEEAKRDPVVCQFAASDILHAVKTNFRYTRNAFKKRLYPETDAPPPPETVRAKQRHEYRMRGLWYFKNVDDSVKRNYDLMDSMDTTAHSDDEEDGKGCYVAKHPVWRTKNPIIQDFFRTPDILFFSRRFHGDDFKHQKQGPLPSIRTHPDIVDEQARPPSGLPRNFYDERWLKKFEHRNPLLATQLDIQPALDLKDLVFSKRVDR
ncbi:hypothetical protein BDZ89DRAFT_1128057 [Hymenopellis radicata]|nr:hypothetical protein BDZ89DRAFT_1128057 [Hymenopellis radicata]